MYISHCSRQSAEVPGLVISTNGRCAHECLLSLTLSRKITVITLRVSLSVFSTPPIITSISYNTLHSAQLCCLISLISCASLRLIVINIRTPLSPWQWTMSCRQKTSFARLLPLQILFVEPCPRQWIPIGRVCGRKLSVVLAEDQAAVLCCCSCCTVTEL